MADMTMADYKILTDDGKDGAGSGAFLWIILIFLFFLAFSGGGLFGNNGGANGMAQVERDVLTTSCGTQKEVLENRYANALQFANLSAQNAACCCELKQAIVADGSMTRALITENIIQGLRDELSDAKTTLSNANQSQYILGQTGRYVPYAGYNPCGCGFDCGCNG